VLQIGRKMRGKKFPAVTKPVHVRGYDDCFQDRAERALWQLSLILSEVASNTSGNKDHRGESPPTVDEECKNGGKQELPHQ
jgi:hypothetical protein